MAENQVDTLISKLLNFIHYITFLLIVLILISDFETVHSAKSNNQSMKYLRCTLSDYKDIRTRIFDFVTKTQFLSCIFNLKKKDSEF